MEGGDEVRVTVPASAGYRTLARLAAVRIGERLRLDETGTERFQHAVSELWEEVGGEVERGERPAGDGLTIELWFGFTGDSVRVGARGPAGAAERTIGRTA